MENEIINSTQEVLEETKEVTNINDLKIGMNINAIIKKIVKFGAFVDLGIGIDGLIHISKMSDKFVHDPAEIVSEGEQVNVKVIDIDYNNKKISLSMIDDIEKKGMRNHRNNKINNKRTYR